MEAAVAVMVTGADPARFSNASNLLTQMRTQLEERTTSKHTWVSPEAAAVAGGSGMQELATPHLGAMRATAVAAEAVVSGIGAPKAATTHLGATRAADAVFKAITMALQADEVEAAARGNTVVGGGGDVGRGAMTPMGVLLGG
jgi:hypothetical protein